MGALSAAVSRVGPVDVIESLRLFRAVARARSFTAAAHECGVPQPVVSRRIAALEQLLEVRLLDRTSRSVSITDAGERILPHTEELLGRWERIEAACRTGTEPIRIAIPYRLDPQALAAIRRGLGRLDVRFVEADRPDREAGWRGGRYEVALLTGPPGPGTIDVDLGVGLAETTGHDSFSPAWLRRSRTDAAARGRVIQLSVEDDLPEVRDPLVRLAYGHGLRHDQIAVTADHTETLTRVHEHGDVWVCSRVEARAAGLSWLPVRGLAVARGHQLRVAGECLDDAESTRLRSRLARTLGSDPDRAGEPR